MKTFIITVLMIFCVTLTTYAEKQEWYDSSYDFTKTKSIVFMLWLPEDISDLAAREIRDIYYGQIKTKIYDKLNNKCKIVSYNKLLEELCYESNMTEQQLMIY